MLPRLKRVQSVPVTVEKAKMRKMIRMIIPQPQPVQEQPRPKPKRSSSQSKAAVNKKSLKSPSKQP